jgi:ribosomal protein L11 methyltransferase
LQDLRIKIDLPNPAYSSLENKNWAAAWQERYHPIPLGEKLIVVPSWLENPQPGRIPIFIDPGMAFGSGVHETTQLCLILLEDALSEQPSTEMIDVGCGSGILSIAAAKLGVKQILGVDSEPEAIRVSVENAKKNGVKSSANFASGSVAEILSGKLPLSRASLVVANIIAPILEELFQVGLGELVPVNGRLILSGILQNQMASILNCLEMEGFEVKTRKKEGEWIAVLAEKTPK